MIVPDGVLFGSSNAHKQARKMLLNDCELQGIVSMPSGVFKPYAGVSTAILIFVKGGETERVWFYDMQSDGFSLDDKRAKINGGGDLPDIVDKWKHRKEQKVNDRSNKFFWVDKKEIEKSDFDLSINRYRVNNYEEAQYDDPKIILDKIDSLENDIVLGIRDLRNSRL
jgi:type I restriction enzyme M protein